MIIYYYHPETYEYLGMKEARESPLDKKLGRTVYLIPKNATEIAPPEPQAGYTLRWTGSQWEQFKPNFISKTVTKKVYRPWLEVELKKAFPSITVALAGDVEADIFRTITFHNIPNTDANNEILDSVIAAHVLPGTKFEHLGSPALIAFQVLCEEMCKINPSFPDFATFSQLVNTKLQTKE